MLRISSTWIIARLRVKASIVTNARQAELSAPSLLRVQVNRKLPAPVSPVQKTTTLLLGLLPRRKAGRFSIACRRELKGFVPVKVVLVGVDLSVHLDLNKGRRLPRHLPHPLSQVTPW